MNASILQLCCKEAFIESCASILFPKECTWYSIKRKRGPTIRQTSLFFGFYTDFNCAQIFLPKTAMSAVTAAETKNMIHRCPASFSKVNPYKT